MESCKLITNYACYKVRCSCVVNCPRLNESVIIYSTCDIYLRPIYTYLPTYLHIISKSSKFSLRIFFSASQYPIRKLADELINFDDDILKHTSGYIS